MTHNIEYKSFEPEDRIRTLVDSLITKLEKKARNFPLDVLFLWLLIEGNRVRTLYRVTITLEVTRNTLATKEERHDLEAAIKDAFVEIERQLEEHKSRLRGEHHWKRFSKREEIRQMKVI